MMLIPTKYYDIDWLKTNHHSLRAFGLGFLQLKLNDTDRMHFWHCDYKREREEVHNHRYDFTSTVVCGGMNQEIFSFEECSPASASHELFHTNCEASGESFEGIRQGILLPQFSGLFQKGTVYNLNNSTLHRIEAERCVTVLRRGTKVKTHAAVVRRIGEISSCPFADEMPERKMWELVRDLLDDVDV